MANFYDKTAQVNVFLETAPVSSQSFQFPLVLLPHNLTSNAIDSFSSSASVVSAGGAVNSPVYLFATGVFGGIAAPSLMKVARATLDSVELTVQGVPAVGEDVSVNGVVDGVSKTVSYEVVQDDTSTEVAAGLATALTAAFATGVTFTAATNKITADTITVPVSFGWQSLTDNAPHVKVEDITSENLVTVATAALAQDDDVSFAMAESHSDADITALANYFNGTTIQYFPSTADPKAADGGDTSNISYNLSQLKQKGVSLVYHTKADTHFPEAYVVGNLAGLDPYQLYSVNNLTLEGVPIDKLTDQQRITLTQRNTNYYISEHGDGNYKEGWAMDGNFIDTVRFGNWLGIASELALYGLIKRRAQGGRAVPYSDFGALQMENTVTNDVINVGINGGRIATGTTVGSNNNTIDLNPVVNFKTRADQTNNNIAARFWEDAVIEVVFISGIHHVSVNAYVILNRDPIQ